MNDNSLAKKEYNQIRNIFFNYLIELFNYLIIKINIFI